METNKENQIKEILNSWEVPSTSSNEDAWQKLQGRIDFRQETKVVEMPRRRWMLTAISAAAAVLIAVLLINPMGSSETVFASLDGHKQVTLPDGSKVYMNENSEISYSEDNWDSNRKLSLKGEAFFEVEKGSSFEVATSSGTVTVLGTSFNIYERSNNLDVECYTGKVSVKNTSNEVILTKGLCTRLVQGKMSSPSEFDFSSAPWMKGEFSYQSSSLGRVFGDIESEFDTKVELDESLVDLQFTGTFDNSSAETAMEIVCTAMGLSYSNTNGRLVVSK